MKMLLRVAAALFVFAICDPTLVHAKPIKPQPGESLYGFCKRKYDDCVGDIVFRPDTQPYNVAKEKCRNKWKSCVKKGEWDDSLLIRPNEEIRRQLRRAVVRP